MALVKKKKKDVVWLAVLLLLISAASSAHARRRMSCYRIKEGIKVFRSCTSKYEMYIVDLRKPPNADAMDDDAWRRWYESYLPRSNIEDDAPRYKSLWPNYDDIDDDVEEDELRYFNCFTGYDYGHLLLGLTGSEPEEMANKPGVVGVFPTMEQPWVVPSNTPCSRNASIVSENELRVEFEIF